MAPRSESDTYAERPQVDDPGDCFFYHRMEVPGHGLVGGDWDLRGHESEYLGGVALEGRRVLEIGPASGFLTFWMERAGAEVVAVELSPDDKWDSVPLAGVDQEALAARQRKVAMLRNGFWFAHRRHRSRARVHYGNAARLPDALGRFDLAVLAAVLVHLRDPLGALTEAARVTDQVVVTEPLDASIAGEPFARLIPSAGSPNSSSWWYLGPRLVCQYLEALGFATTEVTTHAQRSLLGPDEGGTEMPFFTVVATR